MDHEDNLDSFLDVIDADPDWSSDEEDPIAKRANARPTTPPKDNKNKSDLKFEDVFGSPIKKKSKVVQEPSPAGPSTSSKPAATFDHEFFENLRKSEQHFLDVKKPAIVAGPGSAAPKAQNSSAPYGIPNNVGNTSDTVMDPYSRISLVKTSVTLYCDDSMKVEAVLKDRNLGLQYVNLLAFKSWYLSNKDNKKFWTSGVLTKKLPGIKKSAKGNDYVIWEVNDLKDLENAWTVFLFGGAATASSLMEISVGAYIDLVTPLVMDSNNGPLKFSVSNTTQVRHIATARYFGYCQAKRKDGKNCTVVVNTVECGVCIHHASGELKKLNRKSNPNAKAANQKKSTSFNGFGNDREECTAGVVTATFGAPAGPKVIKSAARMELQGGLQSLHKTSFRQGNHPSITFEQPRNEHLPKEPKKVEVKEPLKLDPHKTRHLTDKDREILESLGAKNVTSDLPAMVATNPNAGSRNYIQYLAKKQFDLDKSRQDPGESMNKFGDSIGMNREKLENMKKALNYVRQNGKISKAKANVLEGKKRKLEKSPSSTSKSTLGPTLTKQKSSSSIPKPDIVFDFESEDFKKILSAKSKHEGLLEEVKQEEYFEKLEKKEAIENKMLSTFSIQTTAVMCRECKYVALGQSEYCKEQHHQIRVVKATKRFFKCKDCGNRAMSLDRLPKHPCKNCNSTSWLQAPVGKERKGPTLESEVLSIRGDEEKFLGASSGKLFLNISM